MPVSFEPVADERPRTDADVLVRGLLPPESHPNGAGISSDDAARVIARLPADYQLRLLQSAARAAVWRGPVPDVETVLDLGLEWRRDGASPLEAWHEYREYQRCRSLAYNVAVRAGVLRQYVDEGGLRMLAATDEEIREKADAEARRQLAIRTAGAREWTPDDARAVDPHHHRRRIRAAVTTTDMHVAAILGLIGRQPNGSTRLYVSETTLGRHMERRRRGREFLARHEISRTDGSGKEVRVNLAEVKSTGERARQSETYAMLLGMEDLGAWLGYTMILVSATLPPEWHPNPDRLWRRPAAGEDPDVTRWRRMVAEAVAEAQETKPYDPALSPYKAVRYMNSQWHKAMAGATRLGLRFFGVCGREAQKDSTPHLHAALWVHPDDYEALCMSLAGKFPEVLPRHADAPAAERVACNIRTFTPKDGDAGAKAASYAMHYAIKGAAAADDADADRHAHDAWKSAVKARGFSFVGLNAGTRTLWRTIHREGRSDALTCPRMRAVWFAMRRREWGRALLVLGATCNVRPAPSVRLDARPWAAAQGRTVIVPARRRALRLDRVMAPVTSKYGDVVWRTSAIRGPISGVWTPTKRHRWQIVEARAGRRSVSDGVRLPRGAPPDCGVRQRPPDEGQHDP